MEVARVGAHQHLGLQGCISMYMNIDLSLCRCIPKVPPRIHIDICVYLHFLEYKYIDIFIYVPTHMAQAWGEAGFRPFRLIGSGPFHTGPFGLQGIVREPESQKLEKAKTAYFGCWAQCFLASGNGAGQLMSRALQHHTRTQQRPP